MIKKQASIYSAGLKKNREIHLAPVSHSICKKDKAFESALLAQFGNQLPNAGATKNDYAAVMNTIFENNMLVSHGRYGNWDEIPDMQDIADELQALLNEVDDHLQDKK